MKHIKYRAGVLNEAAEAADFDSIKKTPGYEELIGLGMSDVTTDRQAKNGTVCFSVPPFFEGGAGRLYTVSEKGQVKWELVTRPGKGGPPKTLGTATGNSPAERYNKGFEIIAKDYNWLLSNQERR